MLRGAGRGTAAYTLAVKLRSNGDPADGEADLIVDLVGVGVLDPGDDIEGAAGLAQREFCCRP
jgi:hypothetical protein